MAKLEIVDKRKCSNRSGLLWSIVVFLAAIVPYLSSLSGDFVLDDWTLIVNNPIAHKLSNIPIAFSTRFLPSSFGDDVFYYRPLTTISYQLNYAFAGSSPLLYRLVNLLLEAIAALLVFFIAKRLSKNTIIAGIAGIAFAVVPSHVESVAWISGRTDILSGIFLMGSFLVFLINSEREKGFSWHLASLSSLLFFCGLLSKEITMMLPALMAVYVWIYGGVKRKDILRWCLVLLPSLLIYMALRRLVVGTGFEKLFMIFFAQRLLVVGIAYASYLRMLFIPMEPRVAYYVFPIGLKYPALALAAWLLPIGLGILAVLMRKRQPIVALGAAWILVTLLPVSNIFITLGSLPAERFSYLASFGSALLIGWVAYRILELRSKAIGILPLVSMLIISSYFIYSAGQLMAGCPIYKTNLNWAKAIHESNAGYCAFRPMAGDIFVKSGIIAEHSTHPELAVNYYEDAIQEYEAAISLLPSELNNRIALAQVWRHGLHKPYEAIKVLMDARSIFGASSDISYALALSYIDANQPLDAERELKYIIAHEPKKSPLTKDAESKLSSLNLTRKS